MKKTITSILIGGMALALCACGKEAVPMEDSFSQAQQAGNTAVSEDTFREEGTEETQEPEDVENVSGGLRLICDNIGKGCWTEEGYYYLAREAVKLSDGSYGSHLMYMDFATQKEIYLCSNAGCTHDTPECQAVFLEEDFFTYTCMLYVYQDALWLLNKRSDNSGTTSMGDESFVAGSVETSPATLYRMNLDGTEREIVYTFDADLTLEDLVLGDEKGFYLVTKKLTAVQDGAQTYMNAEERSLIFLDPEEKEEQMVCSLEFGNHISWNIVGCSGRSLMLRGLDYGREITREEEYDDDSYKSLYEKSQEVFACFSLEDFQLTEKYRMDNKYQNSAVFQDNLLYASTAADNSVRSINFETGEEKVLYQKEGEYYYLLDMVGDKIQCHLPDDYETFYYMDKNTGQVSHSSQVNKSLGWSLEIRGVMEKDVLVIYAYDASPSEYGTGYTIHRFQYGLISQEDLFAGKDNYRKIDMVGRGE